MSERVSLDKYFHNKMRSTISEKFKIPLENITEEVFNKYLVVLIKASDWFLPWSKSDKDFHGLLKNEYEKKFQNFFKEILSGRIQENL